MNHAAAPVAISAGMINGRLIRLPATRSLWNLIILISIGGWFEIYTLFYTAYVGPGLVKSGLLTTTTAHFFGISGLGAFVAATFVGLLIGTITFGHVADRYGRRCVFTGALIWYSLASIVTAQQTTAGGINLWRLISAIGIGIELVTLDAYVAELVPANLRGRAFAMNRIIQYSAIPTVALLAWWLIPLSPLGFQGWRWVVLIGAVVALPVSIVIWRYVPESPRWLAQVGRLAEADAIVTTLEAKAAEELGRSLPVAVPVEAPPRAAPATFAEIWSPEYRVRTIMLMILNFFQTIAVYGFSQWLPTLLVAKGITMAASLAYSFAIAIAYPIAPLLGMAVIDRIERKWMIVSCALSLAVFGPCFLIPTAAGTLIITVGVLITLSSMSLALAYHTYQAELFPTRIRARAVGFVYSLSRASGILDGFLIPFVLRQFGLPGVLILICGSMLIVVVVVALFGPRTRGLTLEAISH